MTESHAQAKAGKKEPADTPHKPSERGELDAEIVRDLEAESRTDDVRGGCVGSLPGGCHHSAGV